MTIVYVAVQCLFTTQSVRDFGSCSICVLKLASFSWLWLRIFWRIYIITFNRFRPTISACGPTRTQACAPVDLVWSPRVLGYCWCCLRWRSAIMDTANRNPRRQHRRLGCQRFNSISRQSSVILYWKVTQLPLRKQRNSISYTQLRPNCLPCSCGPPPRRSAAWV